MVQARPLASLILSLAVFASVPAAHAQTVPGLMNQEGLLIDAGGVPLAGPVNLRFQLFAAAAAGNPVWVEDFNNTPLVEGYYNVLLGGTSPIEAPLAQAPYLQITVNGQALQPRTRLVSVPYALNAKNVVGGSVSATTVSVGGIPVIDAQGRWIGNPAGLQGPMGAAGPIGPVGPAGPAGPAGGDGSPDTPQQVLAKLVTVDGAGSALDADRLDGFDGADFVRTADQVRSRLVTVDGAASGVDSDLLDGQDSAAFLRKAESNVDVANGGITLLSSGVAFKAANARGLIAADVGSATVANDADANALVVAGRRGNNEADRRIELRGATTVSGPLLTTGPTVMRGGLYVGGAAGAVRPVIDDQGRWTPESNPLAGQICADGQVVRGVDVGGVPVCVPAASDAQPGVCTPAAIPCDVENGWGEFEYDEAANDYGACIPKGCVAPARMAVPDAAQPWRNYCRFDENTNALCNDRLDNDEDGLADCGDPDCANNAQVNVCALNLVVPAGTTFNINRNDTNNRGGVDAPVYRMSANVRNGGRVISVSEAPSGLLPGDELLIITVRKGAAGSVDAVGYYETQRILSLEGSDITLSAA